MFNILTGFDCLTPLDQVLATSSLSFCIRFSKDNNNKNKAYIQTLGPVTQSFVLYLMFLISLPLVDKQLPYPFLLLLLP